MEALLCLESSVSRAQLSALPRSVKINHGKFSVILDCELLGNSGFLRKLCCPDGEATVQEPATFEACARLSVLPSSAEDFEEWMSAYDYLCADPSAEMFLAAVARAFRSSLKHVSDTAHASAGAIFSERIQKRKFLNDSLDGEGNLSEDDALYADVTVESGPRDHGSAQSCSWEVAEEKAWMRTLSVCERAWIFSEAAQQKAASCATLWRCARELLRSVVLGLGENVRTAPCVVMHIDRLLRFVSPEEVRWMTRRALGLMFAAETRGEQCFVGLDYVAALRRAYASGKLDLYSLCFLPDDKNDRAHGSVYLLPGCRGRCKVHSVQAEIPRLRRSCEERIPWLQSLWARLGGQGKRCFLAGSQLTCALMPDVAALVAPNDIDIFVEEESELQGCLEELLCSIQQAAPAAEIATTRVSSKKFRVLVQSSANAAVDLYCHPLERLNAYHMSAMRVAFDGANVYCAPSAAAALCTCVSAAFVMHTARERALHVVLRKWQSGFSLLVNVSEARAFLEYIKGRQELLGRLAPNTRQQLLNCREQLLRCLELKVWTDRDSAALYECNKWRS